MRRFAIVSGLGILISASTIAAQAQTTQRLATLQVVADGTTYTVPMHSEAKHDTGDYVWRIGGDGSGWQITTPDFSISVTGEANEDPYITYGIAVSDFGAPSAFGFFFTTPIVPTGSPNTVRSSISGALTDVAGDGVWLTPTLADADGDTVAELQTSDLTAPVTNMGVDVGPAVMFPAAPSATYPFGAFTAGPQPGPGPGPWTGLQASLGFMLSGGSDFAVITGLAEIVAVPEPGVASLVAIACCGLVRRRRR